MSQVLFNPTNEDMKGVFAGETINLPTGCKIKVYDAMARHLLNELGPRGLTSLDYGDDEKQKAREALERSLAFKKKQVMDINRFNQQRQSQNQAYVPPTEEQIRYAKELGVELLEPFTIRHKEKEIDENFRLKNKVAELEQTLKEMRDMMESFVKAEKSAGEGDTKKEKG